MVALGVAQDYVPRRVVGKQDAVAIVEPPKDVVMVDLVDDSGNEVSAASSDLETALFPFPAGKLGRVGPLDATTLAELAAGTARGPGPAAHKKDDGDDDDDGDDADGMTVPKKKPMKVRLAAPRSWTECEHLDQATDLFIDRVRFRERRKKGG